MFSQQHCPHDVSGHLPTPSPGRLLPHTPTRPPGAPPSPHLSLAPGLSSFSLRPALACEKGPGEPRPSHSARPSEPWREAAEPGGRPGGADCRALCSVGATQLMSAEVPPLAWLTLSRCPKRSVCVCLVWLFCFSVLSCERALGLDSAGPMFVPLCCAQGGPQQPFGD